MSAPALQLLGPTDPEYPYWRDRHDTANGMIQAKVEEGDDGELWSWLSMHHCIGKELCLSMHRDDWLALATLCEQAVRYYDKLEGEIHGR